MFRSISEGKFLAPLVMLFLALQQLFIVAHAAIDNPANGRNLNILPFKVQFFLIDFYC